MSPVGEKKSKEKIHNLKRKKNMNAQRGSLC